MLYVHKQVNILNNQCYSDIDLNVGSDGHGPGWADSIRFRFHSEPDSNVFSFERFQTVPWRFMRHFRRFQVPGRAGRIIGSILIFSLNIKIL